MGRCPDFKSRQKKVGVDRHQFPNLTSRTYRERQKAFGQAYEAIRAAGGRDILGIEENEVAAARRNEGMRNSDNATRTPTGGRDLLDATK